MEQVLGGKTHEEVLGIGSSPSWEEVKREFRKLARLVHPDKCELEEAEEAFKKLSAAYLYFEERRREESGKEEEEEEEDIAEECERDWMYEFIVQNEELYECLLCRLPLDNVRTATKHVGGPLHRNNFYKSKKRGGKFHCQDCDVTSIDRACHFFHLQGKRHRKLVQRKKDEPSKKDVDSKTSRSVKEISPPHFKRKKEKEEYLRKNFLEYISREQVHCWLCPNTMDQEVFFEHICSQKHKDSLQNYLDVDEYFCCTPCDVSSTNAATFLQHLQGKKHISALGN